MKKKNTNQIQLSKENHSTSKSNLQFCILEVCYLASHNED